MAIVDNFISQLVRIANDNSFRYYNASLGETNGLGNVAVPYTLDCATYCAYAIYCAYGWPWANQTHGYFWPYVTQTGFDDFLVNTIGLTRTTFVDESQLQAGDIIMCDETLHHNLQYLGNGTIIDANNYFGYGDNSIAARSYPTYDPSTFVYVYSWGATPTPQQARWSPRSRRRRRLI